MQKDFCNNIAPRADIVAACRHVRFVQQAAVSDRSKTVALLITGPLVRGAALNRETERELIDGLAPPAHTGAYDFRYSVLYLGPSSLAFLLRCSRSCSVRLGGGAVRASTGSPIAMKNSSCPGGVHMQSIRAAPPEIFL